MATRPGPVYDRIGIGYQERRRPEPQWATRLSEAVGDAPSVLNVGAGTGSYEPRDRFTVAVEPSSTMIAQRAAGAAPVVRAVSEHLPVADRSFDTALAVLTLHHWSDPAAGLAELRRTTRRQVLVTWDPTVTREYWLVRDYLPQIAEWEAGLATLDTAIEHLDVVRVEPLPVPAQCRDGVMAAYWQRPEAYLDPRVRAAISNMSLIDPDLVIDAMGRLERDLTDGAWHDRHRDLLDLDELDVGYCVVVAGES
jgi:SAM-dependent methyltransferase